MADNVTLTPSTSTTWTNGNTYVTNGDVTIADRITVEGDVTLILTDCYTLTAPNGIEVRVGNSLTIQGGTNGTGKLTIEKMELVEPVSEVALKRSVLKNIQPNTAISPSTAVSSTSKVVHRALVSAAILIANSTATAPLPSTVASSTPRVVTRQLVLVVAIVVMIMVPMAAAVKLLSTVDR